MVSLHPLTPSSNAGRTASECAPAGAIRPMVPHRVLTILVDALTPTHGIHSPFTRQRPVVKRRPSTGFTTHRVCRSLAPRNRVAAPLPRQIRAVVRAINVVNGCFWGSSSPIATVGKTGATDPLADQERATSIVPTTVRRDGAIRLHQEPAYVRPLDNRCSDASSVALAWSDAGAIDRSVPATVAGRLINQPQGGSIGVAQTEGRTYRIAGDARSTRRSFMRLAVADGVVTPQEDDIDRRLQAIEDALEQKADDERAAIALLRTGRTKHTRGIVVDLFPTIGPEAA